MIELKFQDISKHYENVLAPPGGLNNILQSSYKKERQLKNSIESTLSNSFEVS